MTVTDAWTRAGNSSGTWSDEPDKGTFHTTEGGSIEGAIAAYVKNNSWPHKTVDYRAGRRRICTHLPVTVPARSLRNNPGGIQTNRDGTLQWELVGNAASILDQYQEQDWLDLGADVIGPDCRAAGVPLTCTLTFHPYPPDDGHRLGREPWRLRGEDCDNYQGLMGHQHWDENSHGDPGDLSAKHYRHGTTSAIDLILEGAGTNPTNPTQEPLMVTDDDAKKIRAIVASELDNRGLATDPVKGTFGKRVLGSLTRIEGAVGDKAGSYGRRLIDAMRRKA